MHRDKDEDFMEVCFQLAAKGKGHVSPNPLVGAVLVKRGRIVARGYHHRFGGPHAEVECLRSYAGDLHGTTLYVNLEPCSHQGKTPPCADLLIEAGIRSVVVAMKDPNPLVSGRGIRKLRRAGVRVVSGTLERDAKELNHPFATFVTKRRPFIHVKVAQSLDGRIALHPKSPIQITGRESQALVHEWRSEHDLVLVGVGTIHADDPLLTVRLTKGRDPAVAILDGKLSIDLRSRVLRTAKRRRVMLFVHDQVERMQQRKVRELASLGVQVLPVKYTTASFRIKQVIKMLYLMNVGSVFVEGGSLVFDQFLREGLVDILSVFVAPKVLGSGVPSFASHSGAGLGVHRISQADLRVKSIGPDALLQYRFN